MKYLHHTEFLHLIKYRIDKSGYAMITIQTWPFFLTGLNAYNKVEVQVKRNSEHK